MRARACLKWVIHARHNAHWFIFLMLFNSQMILYRVCTIWAYCAHVIHTNAELLLLLQLFLQFLLVLLLRPFFFNSLNRQSLPYDLMAEKAERLFTSKEKASKQNFDDAILYNHRRKPLTIDVSIWLENQTLLPIVYCWCWHCYLLLAKCYFRMNHQLDWNCLLNHSFCTQCGFPIESGLCIVTYKSFKSNLKITKNAENNKIHEKCYISSIVTMTSA